MELKLCEKAKLFFYYKDNKIYIQVDKLIHHIKDCNDCLNNVKSFYKSLNVSPVVELIVNNLIKTYGG